MAAIATIGVAATPLAAGGSSATRGVQSRFDLANRCWAIASPANGKFIGTDGADAYRADKHSKAKATAFYLKPTRLGAYLVYDSDGALLTTDGGAGVGRSRQPGKLTEWAPDRVSRHRFEIASTASGRRLAVSPGDGRLGTVGPRSSKRGTVFEIVADRGCRRYPEARAGASGRSFRGTNPNGTVSGFVDAHLHITANMRAGGRVLYGQSFARFGITRALGLDARVHGPDGSLDVTGNLLRDGVPTGTHDTHGWPSFVGWPVFDTNTHQQTYYVWLKRMWKAGERLVVAQTVEDQPLCRLEPVRARPCDETRTIKLEIRRLRKLQNYVDAQSGGPGRGWFRIVESPREARRAIERGKLAVLIGIESSDLFGCSEFMGEPQCTRAGIDRGIRSFRRLGVRSMFVAHWVDNAFAGAALEGGSKGAFINVFEALQTGHYFDTGRCPEAGQGEEVQPLSPPILKVLVRFFPNAEPVLGIPIPEYPEGPQCNTKGLTRLGAYLIRRLMDNHMLIEVDHMSERARLQVLQMAEKRHYPLVSSHTNTGGTWTPSDLRRLYALGGFATATPAQSPELAEKILGLRPYRSTGGHFGVGLGTDTGGFSELPGPRPDAAQDPLPYPFRSYDGQVRFRRERTGRRTFDLNADGVAHYGLFADLLADMQRQPRGRKAMPILFRSAEAYLDTWRRAIRHG